MPEQIYGEECLNISEIQAYLGWTYITVARGIKKHGFPSWTVPGKGIAKYYRKSDIDTLKQPTDGQRDLYIGAALLEAEDTIEIAHTLARNATEAAMVIGEKLREEHPGCAFSRLTVKKAVI